MGKPASDTRYVGGYTRWAFVGSQLYHALLAAGWQVIRVRPTYVDDKTALLVITDTTHVHVVGTCPVDNTPQPVVR
jgi:hypothetical protein